MKIKNRMLSVMGIGFFMLMGSQLFAKEAVDTTFGNNGKVLEVLSAENGHARHRAVLVQSDDKIIAAGTARNDAGLDIMAIYKYLPEGSRDLSFGTGGAVYIDHACQAEGCPIKYIPGSEDVVEMMQQSDGKIIVAGTAYVGTYGYNPHHYFGLTRLNSNGTLDTTFGSGGGAIMSEGISFSWVNGAAMQSDDKIVVVGNGELYGGPDDIAILLSRFNANGTPDTGFGTNGSLYMNLSPAESYGKDSGSGVIVQEDGKILVVGSTQVKGCGDDPDGIYTRGLLLRFNSNGTLDSSFDGDGIVKFTAASVFDVKPWDLSETYPCEASVFDSVAVQADGKIVVMGTGFNSPYKMFLARFNTNGSLDTTFGVQGVRALYDTSHYENFNHLNTVFTHISGRKFSFPGGASNTKMILNKDAGITVSGSVYYDGDYYHYDFLALHFTKDGNFDKAYGLDGDASVNVNFPDDFLYGGANAEALAEQSNGQIILAGYADGYDAPSTAVLTRTVLVPKVPMPAILYLLMN